MCTPTTGARRHSPTADPPLAQPPCTMPCCSRANVTAGVRTDAVEGSTPTQDLQLLLDNITTAPRQARGPMLSRRPNPAAQPPPHVLHSTGNARECKQKQAALPSGCVVLARHAQLAHGRPPLHWDVCGPHPCDLFRPPLNAPQLGRCYGACLWFCNHRCVMCLCTTCVQLVRRCCNRVRWPIIVQASA